MVLRGINNFDKDGWAFVNQVKIGGGALILFSADEVVVKLSLLINGFLRAEFK